MKCQFFLLYSPSIFITNAVVKHKIHLNIPEDYFRSISFFQINLLSCQEFYQAILSIWVILTIPILCKAVLLIEIYCQFKSTFIRYSRENSTRMILCLALSFTCRPHVLPPFSWDNIKQMLLSMIIIETFLDVAI